MCCAVLRCTAFHLHSDLSRAISFLLCGFFFRFISNKCASVCVCASCHLNLILCCSPSLSLPLSLTCNTLANRPCNLKFKHAHTHVCSSSKRQYLNKTTYSIDRKKEKLCIRFELFIDRPNIKMLICTIHCEVKRNTKSICVVVPVRHTNAYSGVQNIVRCA